MKNKNNKFSKCLKSENGTVFVFDGRDTIGGKAHYLKVCGNWGIRVLLEDGVFSSDYKEIGKFTTLTPATAEEFLEDNSPEMLFDDEFISSKVESKSHIEYLRKLITDAEKAIAICRCEHVDPAKERPTSYTEDDLLIK